MLLSFGLSYRQSAHPTVEHKYDIGSVAWEIVSRVERRPEQLSTFEL